MVDASPPAEPGSCIRPGTVVRDRVVSYHCMFLPEHHGCSQQGSKVCSNDILQTSKGSLCPIPSAKCQALSYILILSSTDEAAMMLALQ